MGDKIVDFLFTTNEFVIWLMLFFLLLFFYVTGYFIGSFNKIIPSIGQIRVKMGMQAGLMALLSLMLAFTFSASSSRFEKRKEAVLSEANSISSSFIHAFVLPDTLRNRYRELLNDYIDIRIAYVDAARKRQKLDSLDKVTLDKQISIALVLRDYVIENPGKYSNLVVGYNKLLEESLKGAMATQNHVPLLVIYLLILISCFTLAGFGYGSALVKKFNALFAIFLKVLICSIFVTIINLDRLDAGIVSKSEDSLLELKKTLSKFYR